MQVGKYMPLLSSRVENNGQLLLTAQAQPQGDQAWLHIMDNIDNTDKQLHGLCQSAGCAKELLLWTLQ